MDTVAGDANKYSPRDFVLSALYTITDVTGHCDTASSPIVGGRFPHIERLLQAALPAVGLATQVCCQARKTCMSPPLLTRGP